MKRAGAIRSLITCRDALTAAIDVNKNRRSPRGLLGDAVVELAPPSMGCQKLDGQRVVTPSQSATSVHACCSTDVRGSGHQASRPSSVRTPRPSASPTSTPSPSDFDRDSRDPFHVAKPVTRLTTQEHLSSRGLTPRHACSASHSPSFGGAIRHLFRWKPGVTRMTTFDERKACRVKRGARASASAPDSRATAVRVGELRDETERGAGQAKQRSRGRRPSFYLRSLFAAEGDSAGRRLAERQALCVSASRSKPRQATLRAKLASLGQATSWSALTDQRRRRSSVSKTKFTW
jgi:hypothetical protein